MKRLFTTVAAAGLLTAGTGSGAQAQMQSAPLFDLGVYGGLQYSTNWFENRAGEGYSIGPGPIFGAAATFWTSPSFGVRLHGSYFPSGAPDADDDNVGETNKDRYSLNNYFADLDLVFRPYSGPFLGVFASPYFFVGGGALVTNVADDAGQDRPDRIDCVQEYVTRGVCLAYEPSYATVGQGVAGLGFDVLSLGGLGIFGELAAHVYDSPVHDISGDQDKYAVTPRAVLGVKFGFGELMGAPAPVAPIAPPPPAPTPAPPAAPPAPVENAIRVCVVQNGMLTDVDAMYRPATGDTLVMSGGQRRPFGTVYGTMAPSYAGAESWFINNETVRFNNRDYVKFGVPRIITPSELSRSGDVNGIGVWTQAGETSQNVVYVPIRPGCEFQAYQAREDIRVRG